MERIDKFINEHMEKKEQELLRQREIMSEIKPDIRTLNKDALFKNAERTGDDKAAVGSCWKEFWQIFTQEDFPTTCPFCGKSMIEDEIDGCHINIAGYMKGSWSARKYIIPGHHGCNMKLGDEFNTKIEVNAVEAIEK